MTTLQLIFIICIALIGVVIGRDLEAFDSGLYYAHATFYGDAQGVGTMEGACGYGDLFKQGYGLETTALSAALYNNGATCGACYEISCVNDPQWCIPGAKIKVTATNFCPSNSVVTNGPGWCNPPNKHFDLTMPMFLKIVKGVKAGIVPVQYRRVPCVKSGGIKFQMSVKSNPYFNLVLLYNVAGAGDVVDVKIKGSNTNWLPMKRNSGGTWDNGTPLHGQSLSFQVTGSDGRMVQSDNVAPANWQIGQVFEGKNF